MTRFEVNSPLGGPLARGLMSNRERIVATAMKIISSANWRPGQALLGRWVNNVVEVLCKKSDVYLRP